MKHLGRIIVGYLLALLTGGFGVGLIGLLAGRTPWHPDSYWIPLLSAIAAPVVLAVPAALTILVSEILRIRDRVYFVVLGGFFGGGIGAILNPRLLVPAGLILGPLAGWIYWRIAGRHAGAWRHSA